MFTALALGTVLLAGITGCASDDGQLRTPEGSVITTTVTAIAHVDIVNPGHDFADACPGPVPADPGAPAIERVVVTEPALLDAVCALGLGPMVTAVAADAGSIPAYVGPQLGAVPAIGTAPSADAVRAAAPQVVLSTPDTADRAAALRDTGALGGAQVVMIRDGGWQDRFRQVARALGRGDGSQQTLADFEANAARLGAARDARHTQVSLVRFTGNATLIEGTETLPSQVLALMGASRPAWQGQARAVPVIDADFAELDGDVIYVSFDGDAGARRGEATLRSDRWLDLGAPSWNRVRAVDDDVWYRSQGLTAARQILRDIGGSINVPSRG